jgi:cobyrinic acid a,c-diamide synthase
MPGPGRGLIIAAPSSGSGKTTITLGLLRALKRQGIHVTAAKSGPDYIDPRFHQAACGSECVNLDAWAMSPARIFQLVATDGLRIIEGAMGLFDGAPPDGKGSVADLARQLDLPVVLVVDASKTAQSVAALVSGFSSFDPTVTVAGIILNKVGSVRHERILRTALNGVRVLGAVHRDAELMTPSRHLGLVQAQELPRLDILLEHAADVMSTSIELTQLNALAAPLGNSERPLSGHLIGKKIAIAKDAAFDFSYPHLTADILANDGEIKTFSPLKNEPVPQSDIVFLPGGYPELYAAQLANNSNFIDSLRSASEAADIYGECGGYMVLGESLTDADGQVHEMAGLLPLQTSFAERKLHLGYRTLQSNSGWLQGQFNAHEFHYATTLKADGAPLFQAQDAEGTRLGDMGLRRGRVCGSFAHVIDRTCSSDTIPLPIFS